MDIRGKSGGEIEAAVSAAVGQVMKEIHGCGARMIRTHLVDDVVLVVLHDVLSAPQRRLAAFEVADDPQAMACLKQYRALLWRRCRGPLEAAMLEITGLATLSFFQDVCVDRGAEMLAFQLDGSPVVRAPRP